MSDHDPELSVTLTKAGRRRTFDVRPTKWPGRWVVLETGVRPRMRVVADPSGALAARDVLDREIRALLEDGWTPA